MPLAKREFRIQMSFIEYFSVHRFYTSGSSSKNITFRHLKGIFVLVLFLFSITPAFAAPVHVEVIVFSHSATETEFEWFLKPNEVIKVEESIDEDVTLSESSTTEADSSETVSLRNLETTGPVPVEAYVLTEFADAIDENPDFELLNYVSWVQEPVPKSRTKPISLDIPHVDSFLSDELLLAGETTVYEIAQLLQFEIHVTYKPLADTEADSVSLPEIVKRYTSEVSYLLEERRQIQIDDIHYFDHPKFGVVFTIIRPQQPEIFAQ